MNKQELLKKVIRKKTYLENNIGGYIDIYLISNNRKDRDRIIKSKGKLEVYKEVIEVILQS